jgi:hypothetical protein
MPKVEKSLMVSRKIYLSFLMNIFLNGTIEPFLKITEMHKLFIFHSLPQKLIMSVIEPPKVLYHGTTPEAIEAIKSHGLIPMGRQYVHLSVNIEIAQQVGQRKAKSPVILTIKSLEAFQSELKFYRGNDYI